jgi:hypothetical protein
MEQGVTHSSKDEESPAVLIESRFEQITQNVVTATSYRLSRMFGWNLRWSHSYSKCCSPFFPPRSACTGLEKCSLLAAYSSQVWRTLSNIYILPVQLRSVHLYYFAYRAKKIKTLNLKTKEAMELPITWFISTCLNFVWEERILSRMARLDRCMTEF